MTESRSVFVLALALILGTGAIPAVPAYSASPIDSVPALSVLDVGLENNDLVAIESLLNEDLGFDVAGQMIPADEFENLAHDTTRREFDFIAKDAINTRRMSFESFLWGESGAFTAMTDVTLAHHHVVDRDELFTEATMALWEHGELETAVVMDDAGKTCYVYIFPELIYRLSFAKIDDLWYLTAIAARDE